MRPIDADALLKAIGTDIMGGLNYEQFIREAPTIDAMPKALPFNHIHTYDNGMVAMSKETFDDIRRLAECEGVDCGWR